MFTEGTMLVLAGPGSGKTHVIAQRIRYLVEEKHVDPEKILTITFTKAAATEMKSRCQTICSKAGRVAFGTFHSIFYSILRKSKKYHHFTLINEKEKERIITFLMDKDASAEAKKEMFREISRYKNMWPKSAVETEKYTSEFWAIYRRYCTLCEEQEKLDFDDMLRLCHKLFTDNPAEKEKWSRRFLYILVDEFQDVNGMQYELLKLMADVHKNLFAVGDDDQAIYSFRGSDPKYMKYFLEDYPKTRIVSLEENFRCGDQITKAASCLIENNRERFRKKSYSAKEFKNEIVIRQFPDSKKEVQYITDRIKETTEETAILVRTNGQAEFLAEELWKRDIKCTVKGTRKCIYEQDWVMDIMAILYFCNGERKRCHFYRFMNKPQRGIERATVKEEDVDFKKILERIPQGMNQIRQAVTILDRQCNLLQRMNPYGALHLIFHGMHYREYMQQQKGEEETEELIEELMRRAKEYETIEMFLKHVEYYKKRYREEQEQLRDDEKADRDNVQILTYHAAKGLEFDRVYLPMLNNGVVPHGKMLSQDQMEEERRMFYVAVTRAKSLLCLSWYGKNQEKDCSVFLQELDGSEICS